MRHVSGPTEPRPSPKSSDESSSAVERRPLGRASLHRSAVGSAAPDSHLSTRSRLGRLAPCPRSRHPADARWPSLGLAIGGRFRAMRSHSRMHRPRVVVSDAAYSHAESVREVLENDGFVVVSQPPPSSVLAAVAEHRPDVVILDDDFVDDRPPRTIANIRAL